MSSFVRIRTSTHLSCWLTRYQSASLERGTALVELQIRLPPGRIGPMAGETLARQQWLNHTGEGVVGRLHVWARQSDDAATNSAATNNTPQILAWYRWQLIL